MVKIRRILRSSLLVLVCLLMTILSPANVIAGDITFFGTNDIIYYDPDVCSADGSQNSAAGSGIVGAYNNPVIDSNAPDPSVIRGEDGKFYMYTTGFQQFVSSDMVKWQKLNDGISWIKNNPGWSEDRWAPDISKVGNKYILAISGRSSGNRNIGYATSNSAAGPFTYQGLLVNSADRGKSGMGFDIDPNIVQTDKGTFLYYGSGRGYIKMAKLTQDGDKLSAGRSKTVFTTQYGKGPVLAEGAYVHKHGDYYYLYFSTGQWNKSAGGTPYELHVARSKDPTGGFQEQKNAILKGNGSFTHPGHNSVITDASGTDFLIYHAYPKGKDYRAALVDKIEYKNDWPVINGGKGPSNGQQPGSTGVSSTASQTDPSLKAPNGQIKVAQANIMTSTSASGFKTQLDKVIARNPDFVSGNEWTTSNAAIGRSGYKFYRNSDPALDRATLGEASAVVVMWKSDKWTKVDAGVKRVTFDSDVDYTLSDVRGVKHDGKRVMTWVTVQDSNGSKVSFISTHLPVNPNKYAPTRERKILYQKGAERIAEKVKELAAVGPVILAGDLNAQKGDDGPWHPRQVFGNAGMESTHDSLPKVNAYVDYIFYTKQDIKAVSHSTPFNLTDHPYLEANLQFTKGGLYSSAGDSGACTCKAPGSTPELLQGSDNEEKAWNFLISKGLSPEQAAGIMGNISIESKFDPKASNGGNYMGISQWDSGGRWAKYKTWAQGQNFDIYSFDSQMQYTYKEAQDRSNIEGIKKYNDVEHTAWYWGRFFEVAIINGSTSETPLTNVQDLKGRTDEAKRFFTKYSGTAGVSSSGSSTSSESSASCPDSGDGSLANATCSNVNAKPPEDYGLTKFPGTSEKTDKRTLYMVNLANDCLKQQGEKPITVVQGSYCAGSCAGASGSSHDKGATLDIRTSDRGGKTKIMLLLKILREVGFAAWYRDGGDNPSFAGNEHIHAVALGAPLTGPNAPGSPDQLILYCTGGDGLKGGQKDRQLAIVGRPLPEWALHVKPTCTRYPK